MDLSKIFILLPILFGSPAQAEAEIPIGKRMVLEEPIVYPVSGMNTEDCFALVWVEDRVGVYNKPETLETSKGPVTILYTTVGGHADEPDYFEVVDLPSNIVAYPMYADLVPSQQTPVCLMEYVGM